MCMCVCVCVREREKERDRGCVLKTVEKYLCGKMLLLSDMPCKVVSVSTEQRCVKILIVIIENCSEK